MKSVKNNALRISAFSVAAGSALALLPLVGCGSSGETSSTPTPTPSASAPVLSLSSTSESGVTSRVSYLPDSIVFVYLSFPVYTVAAGQNAIEYHIYRNDLLAARIFPDREDNITPGTVMYTDAASTERKSYQIVDPADATKLKSVVSNGLPNFDANTPVTYRIAFLYRTEAGRYVEIEMGTSNTFTPFR